MSIADVDAPSDLHARAGFSTIEMLVSMALVASMAILVQMTLTTTNNAQHYIEAVQRVTERGHNLSYEIRDAVTSSRRLFFADAIGRGYREALDLSSAPPLPRSRMPIINEGARLGPDALDRPTTGNFLLFVGETDATSVVSDPANALMRHIDTYRFMAVYVHETTRRIVLADKKNALDLIEWQSVEYPNYLQIIGIQDEVERATVVSALVRKYGYSLAWDPSGSVDSSFYVMNERGEIASEPSRDVLIEEHPVESRGSRLVYANVQLARTNRLDARRKAVFTVEDASVWSPNGFEVKVVGRSGSRQVWINLVVEVQATGGHSAAHTSTMIMSVKDL